MIAKAKSNTPYIPSWMIESGFNHYQLAILTYVACRGKCFETKKTIWTKLGMAKRTYMKHVKELTEHGWLKHSWINRKKCLEVSPNGTPMNQPKNEKVQNSTPDMVQKGTLEKVQKGTFKKGPKCTTNIPREETKLINQVNKPSTKQVLVGTGEGGKAGNLSDLFSESSSEVSSEEEFSSCNLFPSQRPSKVGVEAATPLDGSSEGRKRLTDPLEAQETGSERELHQALANLKPGKESIGDFMQILRDQGARRERLGKEHKHERIYGN